MKFTRLPCDDQNISAYRHTRMMIKSFTFTFWLLVLNIKKPRYTFLVQELLLTKFDSFVWFYDMENKTKNVGGRPNMLGAVCGSDLEGYYHKLGEYNHGLNGAADVLSDWLIQGGLDLSDSTCKRIVKELARTGKIKSHAFGGSVDRYWRHEGREYGPKKFDFEAAKKQAGSKENKPKIFSSKVKWYERVVREMPELTHWVGKESGEKFDPEKSEVLKWLSKNIVVLEWVFGRLRDLEIVEYDPEKNVWRGVPFSDGKKDATLDDVMRELSEMD